MTCNIIMSIKKANCILFPYNSNCFLLLEIFTMHNVQQQKLATDNMKNRQGFYLMTDWTHILLSSFTTMLLKMTIWCLDWRIETAQKHQKRQPGTENVSGPGPGPVPGPEPVPVPVPVISGPDACAFFDKNNLNFQENLGCRGYL